MAKKLKKPRTPVWTKQWFGSRAVLIPSHNAETADRQALRVFLSKSHKPNTVLRSREATVGFFNQVYEFYRQRLLESAEVLASPAFVTLVLSEYDDTVVIDEEFKAGHLNPEESEKWKMESGVRRRGLKFLAETAAMVATAEPRLVRDDLLRDLLGKAQIAAEEIARAYMGSDWCHRLPEEQVELVVLPKHHPYRHEGSALSFEFQQKVARDLQQRYALSHLDAGLPPNFGRLYNVLDSPMKTDLGFSFTEAMRILMEIIDHSAAAQGFDIPFIEREYLNRTVCTNYGLSADAVQKLLGGFTFSKQPESERVFFNSNQEYRLWRRGFLQFPHPSGDHIVFSRRMARECLLNLARELEYGKIPAEWQTASVNKAVKTVERLSSADFEQTVVKELEGAGVRAWRGVKHIKVDNKKTPIDAKIGDLDTIAFLPDVGVLLVGEVKKILPKTEPRGFASDCDKLLGYETQLERKVNWVKNNLVDVRAHFADLAAQPDWVSRIWDVRGVMITMVPSYGAFYTKKFPCKCVSELLSDLHTECGREHSDFDSKIGSADMYL